jgi:hypothetical protein
MAAKAASIGPISAGVGSLSRRPAHSPATHTAASTRRPGAWCGPATRGHSRGPPPGLPADRAAEVSPWAISGAVVATRPARKYWVNATSLASAFSSSAHDTMAAEPPGTSPRSALGRLILPARASPRPTTRLSATVAAVTAVSGSASGAAVISAAGVR